MGSGTLNDVLLIPCPAVPLGQILSDALTMANPVQIQFLHCWHKIHHKLEKRYKNQLRGGEGLSRRGNKPSLRITNEVGALL